MRGSGSSIEYGKRRSRYVSIWPYTIPSDKSSPGLWKPCCPFSEARQILQTNCRSTSQIARSSK